MGPVHVGDSGALGWRGKLYPRTQKKHLGTASLPPHGTVLMGSEARSSPRQTLLGDLWTDLALDVLDSNLYLHSCKKPKHATWYSQFICHHQKNPSIRVSSCKFLGNYSPMSPGLSDTTSYLLICYVWLLCSKIMCHRLWGWAGLANGSEKGNIFP